MLNAVLGRSVRLGSRMELAPDASQRPLYIGINDALVALARSCWWEPERSSIWWALPPTRRAWDLELAAPSLELFQKFQIPIPKSQVKSNRSDSKEDSTNRFHSIDRPESVIGRGRRHSSTSVRLPRVDT